MPPDRAPSWWPRSRVVAFERHLNAATNSSRTGTLRVTCKTTPADRLRRTLLLDAFHGRHPALRVELVMNDQHLDLSRDAADVKIRAGTSPDKTWSGNAAHANRPSGKIAVSG